MGQGTDQGWSTNAALSWYWLQARPYDPRVRRFLQPDPSKQGSLPDYVYANNDPLDQSDPKGLDGGATQCGQQNYTDDPIQHAQCNVAFINYNHDEANNQAAKGIAETVLIGSLSFAGGEVFAAGLRLGGLGSLAEGSGTRIAFNAAVGSGFNVLSTRIADVQLGVQPTLGQLTGAALIGAGAGAFVGYASEVAGAVAEARGLGFIAREKEVLRLTAQASALGNILQQEATNLVGGQPYDPSSLANAGVYGGIGGAVGGSVGRYVGGLFGLTSYGSAVGVRAAFGDPSMSLSGIRTAISTGSLAGANLLSNYIGDPAATQYPILGF